MEYQKAKSGTVEEEPQWRQCLSATSGVFGMPLGLLYINEKFSGASKQKVSLLYSIQTGCIKKGNPTLACHCALITGCMNVIFA